MGLFFNNNDNKTDDTKLSAEENQAAPANQNGEPKQEFNRQRMLILTIIIGVVIAGVAVLAVTWLGNKPAKSAASILGGSRTATINCLGDSVTAGVTVSSGEQEICSVTYPGAMEQVLKKKLLTEPVVNNDGESEGLAENSSYKHMSAPADIVILQYLYSNCKEGEDPEGILEANIDGLTGQECLVYLVNYPYASFAEDAAAVEEANQYIAKAAKEKRVMLMEAADCFNDLLKEGYTEEDLFSEDGVHLTAKGYEELGKFIATGILADAGLN